jgi:hypothetical protein
MFLSLWRYVNRMARDRLANFTPAPSDFGQSLAAYLARDQGAAAVEGICQALADEWPTSERFTDGRIRAGLALCAMQAIDAELIALHPRSVALAVRRMPSWLDDVRDRRTRSGEFARDENLSLIPRGPLMRAPRAALEEATFVLGDQFGALKVVDLASFEEDGRKLSVGIHVVDQSVDRGVPARRDRRGSEMVSFVPLAEATDDLIAEITHDGATTFIDVSKGPGFEPANLMAAACIDCADSDIVVAPELTVDADDVQKIAAALVGMVGLRPRLVVAGSGLSEARGPQSDLPYNEAVILNGNGARLWAHRKIAAYDMPEETAAGLNLPDPGGSKRFMERIAWSDSITIADVDGLGRCLVLICQDLMMASVPALLDAFRPDWLLVPILDTGTALVRWPAQRARELAAAVETRFVVVSSLTMKAWSRTPYPGEEMGVAIGPKRINRGDKADDMPARQAQVSPLDATHRYATIRWRSATGWSPYS